MLFVLGYLAALEDSAEVEIAKLLCGIFRHVVSHRLLRIKRLDLCAPKASECFTPPKFTAQTLNP